ncbi:MAG: PASTA domain-containing protein [Selenomonadaceae bacterium]|nr:PASTA domain-containing protein [Selenomonadaceae bacterium]
MWEFRRRITEGSPKDCRRIIVSRGGGEPDNKKHEEPKPAQKVHVPNVEGIGLGAAEDDIAGRGLYVGSVTYQESSQAEGTVITQYPSPNAEVTEGSVVDLVIARRPEPQPEPEPEPVREPEPEPIREPEPEPSREPETQPQSNEFPDIPVDVPSREDDQSKGR